MEYTGEEQRVTMVVTTTNDYIAPGLYSIFIFCDGQMIGSSKVNLSK